MALIAFISAYFDPPGQDCVAVKDAVVDIDSIPEVVITDRKGMIFLIRREAE